MFLYQVPLIEDYLNYLTIFHSISSSLALSTCVEWLYTIFLKREKKRDDGSLEDNDLKFLTLTLWA